MIPDILLHYRILQPLGSGAMGEVYLAEDTKLRRRVAIKVLPASSTADGGRQRFEREAHAIAALNHPHIVTIHAVEQCGDTNFIVMEFVEGQTLAQAIPPAGFETLELLRLAMPMADAVAAAHERGITHRDLKPANVMVTTDGRIKVLDFGLARLTEQPSSDADVTVARTDVITGHGHIVGTVAYMSPEQAEGKRVDHRTDIFSLGVVLYEMATGVRPFRGDSSAAVVSSILRDTPRPASEIKSTLPKELTRVLGRALAKDPERRYQTAKDLRNDLQALREESESGLSSVVPSIAARRPPFFWGLGGVGLAAAVALTAWMIQRAAATPDAAPFERLRISRLTTSGKVMRAAVSPDGRYVVHVVTDNGQSSLWLRQTATESNVQIVPPAEVDYGGLSFTPDANFVLYTIYPAGPNLGTAYQVPVLGGTPRKFVDNIDSPLAYSPSGRQVAFVRRKGAVPEDQLITANSDGTDERVVATWKRPPAFAFADLAWSPDGSTIVTPQVVDAQWRFQLAAVNATTGTVTPVGTSRWQFIRAVAWLPEHRGLVIAAVAEEQGATTQLWHIEFPSGKPRRLTNDFNSYTSVSASADGRTIVAVEDEREARLWLSSIDSVADAQPVTSGRGRSDQQVAWAPDNRIVFSSSMKGNNDIWSADLSGTNARALTNHPVEDYLIGVTGDGRKVIFHSPRPEALIWQMNLDGTEQTPLVPGQNVDGAIVSRDMRWVYYMTSPSGVWRMPYPSGPAERLTAPWPALGIAQSGIFYHPTMRLRDLSPDGRTAVGSYDDPITRKTIVVLIPMNGGTPTPLGSPNDDGFFRSVFSADGKSLIYAGTSPSGGATLTERRLADGRERTLHAFPNEYVLGVALSPDSRRIVLSRGVIVSDAVVINELQ